MNPDNFKNKRFLYFVISVTLYFYSCANQLPPTGGDDDRTPPQIISVYPKPNSINYKDNKLRFKFDEYVDRRSFEESFFISPKPKGGYEFDWSGKEVEVEFSKALDKNKTYVIIIGKDLKDIRGGNAVESPVSFAFSTGSIIDEGKISGVVYSDNYERVKILAYLKAGKTEDSLNPGKNIPDYILQVSPDGSYEFTNLPDGEYRIFAVSDEDRNNLFDKDLDKIALLSDDHKLLKDSNTISGLNFLLKDFDINKTGKEFLDLLKSDSINFIYSNISNGDNNIPPDYRFYFYFKNTKLSKSDMVNNFSIADTSTGKSYRLVFNWLNDSLLEVFSTEKFGLSSGMILNIDLTKTDKKYSYERRFTVAGKNSFGKISGKVISDEIILPAVYVKLYNKENKFITYSAKITDSTGFAFDEVQEGNYILISFMDENEDGRIGKGEYYPFRSAERFIIYDRELKVKGGWNVENVFIKY
ncbi:MAG TPA: Ig-like domain-containing protein [Ignavibacteria bacterium]|nr:Ig-like domain-containing protein [Ignavibacteria bacterium]